MGAAMCLPNALGVAWGVLLRQIYQSAAVTWWLIFVVDLGPKRVPANPKRGETRWD